MSVGAFRLALSATANVAVEDAVLSSEIPSFSCSKVPEKIGFGFGVRDFHFSTVALEFRASPVAQAEYAVDDFSDEWKSSGKKVGGDKDEGLEISKLRIALEIVSALAKSGITNLFPIKKEWLRST